MHLQLVLQDCNPAARSVKFRVRLLELGLVLGLGLGVGLGFRVKVRVRDRIRIRVRLVYHSRYAASVQGFLLVYE